MKWLSKKDKFRLYLLMSWNDSQKEDKFKQCISLRVRQINLIQKRLINQQCWHQYRAVSFCGVNFYLGVAYSTELVSFLKYYVTLWDCNLYFKGISEWTLYVASFLVICWDSFGPRFERRGPTQSPFLCLSLRGQSVGPSLDISKTVH